MLDQFAETFPPAAAWSLIFLLWFLALCAFAHFTDAKLSGIPRLGRGVVLAVLATLVGAAALGPYALLPLAAACVVGTIRFHQQAPLWTTSTRRIGYSLTGAGLLALGGSAMAEYVSSNRPATAKSVLLNEQNYYRVRSELRKLRRAEPASLPSYRELILRSQSDYVMASALERIVAIGKPADEVPHLIDALDHLRRSQRHREAAVLEKRLLEFTGLNLASDTEIAAWREAWRKKNGI